MAGLVAYESSDEEEETKIQPASEPLRKTGEAPADADSTSNTTQQPQTVLISKVEESPTVYGPQIGPSSGPSFPPLEEDPAEAEASLPSLPPGSPYTATRALLRDLTLPAVPNMDIPASPPGSPLAATSKKFEHFLELKKKGVHFNSRIASNPSMKNPALVDKLLAFAELGQRDQYRNTLPADLWDPDAFPRWAYKEQLRLSQSENTKVRARGKGTPVDFVPAGGSASGAQDSTAAQGSSTGKRKTRFDT
ncbi:hypothetical protein F5Y19DRAFT_354604 [Xylariaceae sp. FL1651]|nr:hypothetical protein F5Y19DRAFT_354604 [Xylariaceae sp. FL1651]